MWPKVVQTIHTLLSLLQNILNCNQFYCHFLWFVCELKCLSHLSENLCFNWSRLRTESVVYWLWTSMTGHHWVVYLQTSRVQTIGWVYMQTTRSIAIADTGMEFSRQSATIRELCSMTGRSLYFMSKMIHILMTSKT